MTQSKNSIWDAEHIGLTVGSIIAATIAAFQGLAVGTITPVLVADLGGEHLYGWVFNAFLIPQIIGTVLAGSEVDRRPPWQVFYPALALLCLGLTICAMSDSMDVLLAGRALAGFASGAIFSTVYAIISASYPDGLRPAMLAAVSSAWIVPSLIGPVIAGSVADYIHWRWVFVGLLPLIGITVALTWKAYVAVKAPQNKSVRPENSRRLPLAILLAIGTFLFLAGPDLTSLGQMVGFEYRSGSLVLTIAITIAGLVIIAPTLVRLIPAGTFRFRPMLPAAIALRGFAFGGFCITETFVVFALKTFGGLTSSQAGLILTVGSLTWTLGSILQARWDQLDGTQGRPMRMLGGVIAMIIGASVIVAMVLITQDINWLVAMVAWSVCGLGIGICFTTATAVAMQYAPPGEDGVVSSSFLLFDLFNNAIGVGIAGFILSYGLSKQWSDPNSSGLAMVLSLVFLVAGTFAALKMVQAQTESPA